MTVDWQQVVALMVVVAAVVILLRRARRLWKDKPGAGCGSGCDSCAVAHGAAARPLVKLDLRSPSDRDSG
jgi:FeoB-associated Cys-rich membrane protein